MPSANFLPGHSLPACMRLPCKPVFPPQLLTLQKMLQISGLLCKTNPFMFNFYTYKCQNIPSQQKFMYLTSEDEIM